MGKLLKLRFPGGRDKVLTLSYDDDTRHNIRFVEILNRYGIKCTFNLNFGLFAETPRPNTLTLEEAKDLFRNSPHEVAIHGYKHLCLGRIPDPVGMQDLILDRAAAEQAFGPIVRGMAYANGTYDERTRELLDQCGIVYSRTTHSTEDFSFPTDWRYLNPTCHHKNPRLFDLADSFLETPVYRDAKMFYLWGHAYEFNNDNNWDRIEAFCEKTASRPDVWYATNIEIYDYVKAFEQLIYSLDGSKVFNPTNTEVFFALCHPWKKEVPPFHSIRPGETVDLSTLEDF